MRGPDLHSLAEEDRRQEGSSGSESFEDVILVTAREGRLAVWTKVPRNYIHRCGRDDISCPLYFLPYFMSTRLGKTENVKGGSILLIVFRGDVAHVAYSSFIPPPGWGVSVRQLRLTDLSLPQSGLVQSVLSGMWIDLRQWARDVDSALERASTGSTDENSLPSFPQRCI